jgi:hypothetical protein
MAARFGAHGVDMSSPWRITRGDQQFTVKDVAELKLMAVGSKVKASDLIQRPGGTDWLYATEVPELKGLLKADPASDFDDDWKPQRNLSHKILRVISGLLFVGIIGSGFTGLWFIWKGVPDAAESRLFGDHPGAMSALEALATETANLLSEPDSRATIKGVVEKDSRVALIRKLGDYYEIEAADGTTGWVGTGQVIPGYLFDQEMSDKYDPLFNPDTYLQLINYAWTPVGGEDDPDTLTEMMFQVANPTDYGMQGVILRISFFDGADRVLGVENYEVPRLLPPNDSLHLEGIEIDIAWDENTRAEVDILGARALLPDEYARLKAEEDARLEEELLMEGIEG